MRQRRVKNSLVQKIENDLEIAPVKKKKVSFTITQRAIGLVAMICALVVSYGTYNSIVYIAKLYSVQCPYTNGRLCNGRGECIQGICHCQPAFSGISCTETQVPGYNLVDNTECNKRGYVIQEFIDTPFVCEEIIVRGVRVGLGWGSSNCSFYVQAVQRAVNLLDDPRVIAEYFTIPVCNCLPKYGGVDCSEIFCPTDAFGNICGASVNPNTGQKELHGNTSVGLLYNFTNEGVGCQCNSPVTLNDPYYISLIGQERYLEILDLNQEAFTEIYCGTVIMYNTTNSTGGREYSFLVLTTEDDYTCYCTDDWAGRTCTEGKCPGENLPCSGHGAKTKGLGYIANTTLSTNRGMPCSVICTTGKEKCALERCVTTQARGLELFTESPYCDVPYVCPLSRPVRCYDGSCVGIPGLGSHGCVNRYSTGSIDHGRLDVPIRQYACPNITDFGVFTYCFENTTVLDGVTGFIDVGGVVIQSAYTLTFDLGSPLVYFQFATNNTGVVQVDTWDGQGLTFSGVELVSGFFAYPERGDWVLVTTEGDYRLQRTQSLDFILCPMPWNYTGGGPVPSNYSLVRVSQSATGERYVLDLETDFLNLKTYVDEEYLLVKSPPQNDLELWFHPATGGPVPQTQCLANPSFCSFHRDSTAIRSLDSEYYLCSSGGEPILQAVPCSTDVVSLIIELEGYLFFWDTCAVVVSSVDISLLDDTYDTLERDFPRTSYPINITFTNTDTNYSTILDPVWLTLDRITYPCACPGSLFEANQSVLNEEWFNQGTLREPTLDVTGVGDWVLFGLYNTGVRVLKRGIVQATNAVSSVFNILEPWEGVNYTVYAKDVRSITPVESLRGWSDGDLFITPFRCPNGYLSTAEVDYANATASANCTGNNFGLIQCNFTDPTLARWGCDCNMPRQICQCGFPATPDFELDVLARFNQLLGIGCQGILFAPAVEDIANYSSTLENVNSNWVNLLFRESQQPTQLVVKTVTCEYTPSFLLFIGSDLFSNLTYQLEYQTSTNATCEYWFTLYPLSAPAWKNITLFSNSTISWVTTLYATYGFSLTNFNPAPVYTASSNSAQAGNVNLGNGSYWVSSGSLHEIPVWLKMTMPVPAVVDHMTIDFYLLGHGGIQNRVYVQGYLNSSWFSLGSVSAYVEEGGWTSFTLLIDSNATYEAFRLVTQAGRFGVRHWGVFSNQQWSCFDNSNLILRADSLAGLKSISVLLEEIAFFNENVNTLDCIAVDNCTIKVGGGDSYLQVANDGICQDVYYMGSLAGLPKRTVLVETLTFPIYSVFFTETVDFLPGINAVQFTNSSEFLLSPSQLEEFYPQYLTGFLVPFFDNVSYNSTVYFYYSGNTSLILFNQTELNQYYYENFTLFLEQYQYEWGNLLTDELSCPTGYDYTDCGPSSRQIPYMPGVGCALNYAQTQLALLIQNGSLLVNKTYYTANFSELDTWTALFYNVQINRTYLPITLQNCPDQLCEGVNNYMCADGSCVQFPNDCENYYTCPGNGCIEETDASILGNAVYSCNCEPGRAGEACQYAQCAPATPKFLNGIPGAEECTCGGPSPLTLKSQLRNLLETIPFRITRLTTAKLVALNNRITSGSAPKSPAQVANLNILPKSGSWGTVLRIPRRVRTSALLSDAESTFYSSCPFARTGFHGEPKYLENDQEGEDPETGAPIWKTYTNPFTGATSTYVWLTPYSYDEFPWRCANSFCVAQQSDCAAVEALYPLCNGRGSCMADGVCDCFPGWKTFMANEEFSQSIRYPYFVINGVPDSTIWEINWNSVHFGLNQCNTRDCDAIDCSVPVGCFPGTPELEFADSLVPCEQSTGRAGLCAPSQTDCTNGLNLANPLPCSGRGIPRKKDFSNEEYCACGTPVSEQVTTAELSEITQLVPNGWGGPNCDQYYAAASPIYWSSFDFLNNVPYRSRITNEIIPGKWVSGNRIIGPDPDDKLLWDRCCGNVDRLEKCDTVPCTVQGEIQCVEAKSCTSPLVYPCNNHGTALADGTCSCNIDVEQGTGYTHDYTQFSEKGCYKLLQCPDCHFVPACSEPAEWRHPLPYDIGIDQQWYSCIGGLGLYSNETMINEMSSSLNQRSELIVQGLTQIAVRTNRAINDLAACICVYPNDTASVKYGMVTGVEYRYKQNYRSPYNLSGTFPGYPLLQDNTLESLPVEIYTFNTGDSFSFRLENNASTFISAVRVWGINLENTTTLELRSQGQLVCPAILLNYLPDTLQYWIAGSNFAFQCGPYYECYNFRVNNKLEYDANCAIPDSSECLNWQYATCAQSANRVVWELDSEAQYQGCNRESFGTTCTCCSRLSDPSSPVENGIIDIRVVAGSLQMGQMRIYGYTEEALPTPPILLQTLQNGLGTQGVASTCQDRKFFTEYLVPDGDAFAPVQNVTNYAQAFTTCMAAGGYLGTTTEIGSIDGTSPQTDIRSLQYQCGLIGQAQGERCHISAYDTYYITEYLNRSNLIEDNCETCYLGNTLFPQGSGFRPISFSTYPDGIGNTYKVPTFSVNQKSTYEVLADLLPQGPIGITGVNIFSSRFTYAFGVNTAKLFNRKTTADCRITFSFAGNIVPDTAPQIDFLFRAGNMEVWTDRYTYPSATSFFFDRVAYSWVWEKVSMTPRACAAIRFLDNNDVQALDEGNPLNTVPGVFQLDRKFFTLADSGVIYRCNQFDPNTRDETGKPYGNICSTSVNIKQMMFFPDEFPTYYEMKINGRATRITGEAFVSGTTITRTTYGTYGQDFLPGIEGWPFLPAFLDITYFKRYDRTWYEGSLPPPLVQSNTPVYFEKLYSEVVNMQDWIFTAPIPDCQSCIKILNPRFNWDQYIYSQNSWFGDFDPGIKDNVQLRLSGSFVNLSTAPVPFLTHQVTYLQGRAETEASQNRRENTAATQWFINNCLVVGPNGFEAVVCNRELYNFVCLYDYTKYTVVPGYQCDTCGDGSRSGGTPFPGNTCFSQFPLANSTLNPTSHAILLSWQQGTLPIYARSFNLPADVIDFMNKSTIWGFPVAYQFFAQDRSNRPGQSSPGVDEVLNWCDMSVTKIWPIDCGIQVNPNTNERERACVSNALLCPWFASVGENAVIRPGEVPPLFQNADPTIAVSDPTCGSTVKLQSYAKIDKYGGIQDDLDLYVVFLSLTSDFVQFQFNSSSEGKWYNSGKTTTKWVFEAGVTSTVAGRYIMQGCESCSYPVMQVFIHPINVLGTFPTTILTYNISLQNGVEIAYQAPFTVTSSDTGTYVIGGQTFPEITFQGVGYRFFNMTTGASITLYNPVLTNNATITACLSKPNITYYEPKPKIISTAPLRQCLLKEADLLYFPGFQLGQCGCDLSTAGRECNCPAVTSKYGKEVCGGFGDPGTGVVTPDGSIVTTGQGTEAGCYNVGTLSECKTIQLGRAISTLLTPQAPWDYPSVFVSTSPQSGDGLFINPENTIAAFLTYEEIQDECTLEASFIPYYLTADELNQMARKNLLLSPFFIAVTNTSDEQSIPWEEGGATDGSYFINGAGTTTVISANDADLNCEVDDTAIDACAAFNVNNYAYEGTPKTTANDGNIQLVFAFSDFNITYSQSAPLEILVYVFWPSAFTDFITCLGGGFCSGVEQRGNNAQFTCRCPSRAISVAAGSYAEIQVFAQNDLTTATVYSYN